MKSVKLFKKSVDFCEKSYMFLELETKSPLSQDRLDEIFVFADDYLTLPENAYITLRFVDLGEVAGYCDEEDLEEGMIAIEINSGIDTEEELVRTIFHEMVHCRQILEGSLVQGNPSTWKGIEFDGPYGELPWEIEAYKLEGDMVNEFYAK